MPDENRQKAILVQRKAPAGIDGELSELCRMMRIMSERDTDGTLPQVLKAMMVEARDRPVGGSELSRASGLNRITVIHHLRRLEVAGFVRRAEGKYVLRVQSAEDMLMEFRKDMEKNFAEMDEVARQIDEQFSLFERQAEQSGARDFASRAKMIEKEFDERHRKRRLP